jgi:hypothetical protein
MLFGSHEDEIRWQTSKLLGISSAFLSFFQMERPFS